MPRSINRIPGLIPVRIETADGMVRWRGVPNLDHGTLCRAFSFDPCSTWFDLPSSARNAGSTMSGYGSGATGRRVIDGLVFQGPKGSPPIGKLVVAHEDERLREDWLEGMR